MRMKISHLTEYRYDEPAQFSLQRLRLTPPTTAAQKVLGWSLNVEGAKPEVEYDDQYGNHVNLVSLEGAQHLTRIFAEGEVETTDNNGVTGPHTGFCPLWLFLRETPLTKGGKLVKELIKGVAGDNELARMHGCFVVNSVASNAPNGIEIEQTLKELRQGRSKQIAERLTEDVRGGRLRDDTPVQELSDLYAAILQGLAQGARDGLAKERLLTIPRHSRALISPWMADKNSR